MKRPKPNKGSKNAFLLSFTLGERRYIETTLSEYQATMRKYNTSIDRRPTDLKGRRFSTCLFTALSAGKINDIRYLICIERIK